MTYVWRKGFSDNVNVFVADPSQAPHVKLIDPYLILVGSISQDLLKAIKAGENDGRNVDPKVMEAINLIDDVTLKIVLSNYDDDAEKDLPSEGTRDLSMGGDPGLTVETVRKTEVE